MVAAHLGPARAQHRARVAADARRRMRAEQRCELLPDFVTGLQTFVDRMYPAWYQQELFFVPEETTGLRPCVPPGHP